MRTFVNLPVALRGALAVLAVGSFAPGADAAFTVMVNGVIVATDQGTGDQDTDTGVVRFTDTVGNHQIRLTTSTNGTSITTSELQVVGTGGNGSEGGPLEVTISAPFGGAGGNGGGGLSNSLTRNGVGGLGSPGSVGSFTALSGPDGALGKTDVVFLDNPVGAGVSDGSFAPAPGEGEYEIIQTITIPGLGVGEGVTITAGSEALVVAPEGEPGIISMPVPPSAVLMGCGIVLAGLTSRRRLLRA